MAEETTQQPDHVQALNTIAKNINQTMSSHLGEFRKASEASNKNIIKVIKDLGTSILSQKKQLSGLTEAIDEVAESSNKIANKMDQMNNHLMDSINIQQEMLAQMKNVFGGIQSINSNWSQIANGGPNNTSIFGGMLNSLKDLGKTVGTIGAIAGVGYGASKLAENAATPETSYTGEEKSAKASAEKYMGRQLGDQEWKELVKATHAEAGQKNQTEVAMVMATMLNRARDENKSVSDILRAKSQFQSVTGTAANGHAPSQNFVEGPGEKRANQIYGAAVNILNNVDKKQKYFTAGSAAAYGAGTNIGFRDKMLASGGSVVGASVFNTAAPKVTGSVTTSPEEDKQAPPPPAPKQEAPAQQATPVPPPPSTPAPPPTAATPAAPPPEATGGGERKPEGHGGIISGAGGKDGQKQNTDQNGLTTLQTRSGHSFQVAAKYADKFKGFVDELEATGYKIRSIGGYANRNIAGTNTKSWHAQGMAIDINPDANPVTYKGQPGAGKNDLPSNVSAMAAKYGLGWGGNWNHKLDTMHFSFGPNEGGQGGGSSGVSGGPSAGSGSEQTGSPAGGSGGSNGTEQPAQPTAEQKSAADLISMYTGAYSEGAGGAGGLSGIMGGLGGMAGITSTIAPMIPGAINTSMNQAAGIPQAQPILPPETPVPVETPSVGAAANTIEQNALQTQIEDYNQKQAAAEVNKKTEEIKERLGSMQQGQGDHQPGIDYNGPHDQEVISKWAERLGFGGSHFKEMDKIKLF